MATTRRTAPALRPRARAARPGGSSPSLRGLLDRYRLLAEHASDVVVETDAAGVVEWASPSLLAVLGVPPARAVGHELLELVWPEDRTRARAWRSLVHAGGATEPHDYRWRTGSGEARWMRVRSEPVRDEGGRVRATVIALRDAQAEVLARRAYTTLSEGSRALARADREEDLLHRMCQVAVDEGGYSFAWYGHRVEDDARTVAKRAMSRQNRAYLDDLEVSWADVPAGRGPVGTAIRHRRTVVVDDVATDPGFSPWRGIAAAHSLRSAISVPVIVGGDVDGALTVYAAERAAFDAGAVTMFEDLAGELGVGLGRLRDRVTLERSLEERALLTRAVEQAGEAIVLTDRDGTITYANAAVSRVSGYSRGELIGANPRLFQSGHQSPEFYEAMWATLLSGRTWRGVLVNRRKDGSLIEEDATISPIHSPSGEVIAYVAVKHDLTAQRQLEATIDRTRDDHDAVVAAMRDGVLGETVQESAGAFCESATRLSGIDVAAVLLLELDATLLAVGVRGTTVIDAASPVPLALQAFDPAAHLGRGPIEVPLTPGSWPANGELLERLRRDGLHALVLAPIRWRGDLVGVLALGTRQPAVAAAMGERVAFYEELGSYAGSLFGAEARAAERLASDRAAVLAIIDGRAFAPAFQPIVDLSSGRVVGHEALTRFEGGDAPADVFARAHESGLGGALESACVSAAVDAAHTRGVGFLSVNFSASTLVDGDAARALARARCPVVVEVTEHTRIEDFAAVRRAVRAIPGARLAVDDAGAGFASLQHVLELHPDYVKLDISIVRDIGRDQARQAMAAGLCHFASLSGATIIAEGVESAEEADALRTLGASLGGGRMLAQGFLFGGPETARRRKPATP